MVPRLLHKLYKRFLLPDDVVWSWCRVQATLVRLLDLNDLGHLAQSRGLLQLLGSNSHLICHQIGVGHLNFSFFILRGFNRNIVGVAVFSLVEQRLHLLDLFTNNLNVFFNDGQCDPALQKAPVQVCVLQELV